MKIHLALLFSFFHLAVLGQNTLIWSDEFGGSELNLNQWNSGYNYGAEASTRKILLAKKKELAQKDIAKKAELEKKKRLLIEKKRRREAARADKELENLFADHGPA